MVVRFRNAFVLLLVGVLANCSSPSEADLSDPDPNDPGSCEPGPYFSELPVAAEAINYFIVLGQFAPPGDVFPRGQTGLQLVSTDLTPVYAVGDITIRHVESTRWLASPTREGHTDYSLAFQVPSCRVITGTYEHIAVLEPGFEALLAGATCEVYSTESETVEACGRRVAIPVSAGTVLGQAGGTITGLDFDLFDERATFDFVESHRYPLLSRGPICPQALFEPELRDFLLDRTGRGTIMRTAEPRCGTMEIDVAGTAQGMWVLDGENVTLSGATFDKFFALAPNELRPDLYHVLVTAHPAFRVDPWGYVIYAFALQSAGRVNRPFSDVSADGSLYCYAAGTDPIDFFPVETVSFLLALGVDGRITLERRDHSVGESPCQMEAPEAWAFSGAAIQLMR
jgi:hypothetical protein